MTTNTDSTFENAIKIPIKTEIPTSTDNLGCINNEAIVCEEKHNVAVMENENTVLLVDNTTTINNEALIKNLNDCNGLEPTGLHDDLLQTDRDVFDPLSLYEWYECELCDYKSSIKGDFFDHILKHPNEKEYECNICGFKSKIELSLQAHVVMSHEVTSFRAVDQVPDCNVISELKEDGSLEVGIADTQATQENNCDDIIVEKPFENSCNTNGNSLLAVESTNSNQNYWRTVNTEESHFKCYGCDYTCVGLSYLKLHIMKVHKKEFKCNLCNEKFSTTNDYIVHINTHIEERPFTCNECDYVCVGLSYLKLHIMEVHEKEFKCNVCNDKFSNKIDYTVHISNHTEEKPFKCTTCDYTCIDNACLNLHITEEHKKFQCNMCDVKFSTENDYTVHLERHTEQNRFNILKVFKNELNYNIFDQSTENESTVPTRHNPRQKWRKCQMCDNFFSGRSLLKAHIKKVHADRTKFSCSLCDMKMTTRNRFRAHMKRHSKQKLMKCDVCNFVCVGRSHLAVHNMQKHNDNKDHKCDICNIKFENQNAYRNHNMTEHRPKKAPFKCTICKTSYTTKRTFSVHMNQHSTDKRYKCKLCDFTCIGNSNFMTHMEVHEEERKFECTICGDKFLTKYSLGDHIRAHEGKTVKCDLCDNVFTNLRHLVTHCHTEHKVRKTYKCDVCGAVFKYHKLLKSHMRRHTAESPFKCNICNKDFGAQGGLTRHEKLCTNSSMSIEVLLPN